jgi:hypothetical protein
MMGRGINILLEFLDSSPSPQPSPIKGISGNLINGGVFEKIPIGIFDNRPAIYRR